MFVVYKCFILSFSRFFLDFAIYCISTPLAYSASRSKKSLKRYINSNLQHTADFSYFSIDTFFPMSLHWNCTVVQYFLHQKNSVSLLKRRDLCNFSVQNCDQLFFNKNVMNLKIQRLFVYLLTKQISLICDLMKTHIIIVISI